MTDVFKRIFLTGLGAVAVTAEKAGEMIDELVKKGELTFEQGKEMAKEYREKFGTQMQGLDKKVENAVSSVLSSMNIATKDDLKKLQDKLDQLEMMINSK